MNINSQPTPTTYADAAALLWTHNGSRNSLKIANNTYLERRYVSTDTFTGGIAIRLHATDIVLFYEDGNTVINSGGHRTKTTLERINRYLPFATVINKKNDKWNLISSKFDTVDFVDGMVIDSKTGEVL